MKYTLTYDHPHQHFLDIELEVETKNAPQLQFQLPAWRPGRYELGNFAKNIQKWAAFDEKGQALVYTKLKKDLWHVDCKNAKKCIIKYNYFAFDLNAGSTYLDETQLYVNPVNCLLYLPNRLEEQCELKLVLPKTYEVAIALDQKSRGKYYAKNFDELADSPFIASASLKKIEYKVEQTKFYLWFQGEIEGNFDQLKKDFIAFSKEQLKFFGDFPVAEYHFLFQILPYNSYHGVEHCNSTVIALGPSYAVLNPEKKYDDLLGVSSHELFHAWNVKRIRPIEMWPYDFSKENYSRLGYLAEGATTYYGDLMLIRSKVFDEKRFYIAFEQLLDRHFNNPGVQNLSVADSSFDTWLDGYTLGIPNRKSSIYTEGALITFVLDVEIRKKSKNDRSFDDVMRSFYNDFYKKDKGISESDYQSAVEKAAGKKLDEFFAAYVNGTKSLHNSIKEALAYLGLKMIKRPNPNPYESHLGFICDDQSKVQRIFPDSPAEKSNLSIGDKIIAVNGVTPQNDLTDWLAYFKGEKIVLTVSDSNLQLKTKELYWGEALYFSNYKIELLSKRSKEQKAAYYNWINS